MKQRADSCQRFYATCHWLPKTSQKALGRGWQIADMDKQSEIEYGRFPDVQGRFSIGRSKTYQLINEGKIRSVVIRNKGARSGLRLIDMASVRDFLKAQAQ